ncbi:tetratricopeptide repeat protein [Kitasatospora sp. NBC_01287]|uniref:tetratricopeptide repeat protein n=1 Tax=Kitasatospora sp. NBC_01287 TaxID=2903573 RepID=UPI00225641D6|nr:tetratricopeptide repeat protein [Kitasatospora sp. NBC_01287]MCX4745213.1 tetratricopeptide repeat protein [Kitasatospora sp. NBC_01287]
MTAAAEHRAGPGQAEPGAVDGSGSQARSASGTAGLAAGAAGSAGTASGSAAGSSAPVRAAAPADPAAPGRSGLRWAARVAGAAVLTLAAAGGLLALGPAGPFAPFGADRAAAPLPPPPAAADPLAAARSAVQGSPQDSYVWVQLGQAQLDRARLTLDAGALADAERAFQRSLELKPEQNYGALVGLGMLANARHDFGAARQAGQRATAMAPDRPSGYLVLTDAEIQLGDYPAATAAAQRLLDLAPTVPGWTRAAYDLETHGRAEEAGIALRRALDSAQTPGDSAFCEHRLGDLAWDHGQLVEAAEHYRRALAAAPDDYYARAGQARVLAATGQPAQALREYQELVARVPLPQFLLEFAELRLAQGQQTEAADQFAVLAGQVTLLESAGGAVDPALMLYQADHADPAVAVRLLRAEWERRKSVLVADALGWALHRAGQDEEAIALLGQAAATDWHNPLFAYHRGAVEAALRRTDAARADLREALALNPRFSPYQAPLAQRLLAALDSGAATGNSSS